MFKNLFVPSVFLSVLFIMPAGAANWCRLSNDSIAPCANNIIPNDWIKCGSYNQEAVWCYPSLIENKKKLKEKDESTDPSYRFYAGLSVGYVGSVYGGMNADYADQTDSWIVPGSFKQSNFELSPRSIPLQASAGIRVIDFLRIDLSYTHFSGIKLPVWARTATGGRDNYDYFSFNLNGGEVSSDLIMLNAYYNFDRLMGRFMGNKLSPYLGIGLGFGKNKISDYDLLGEGFYSIDAGLNGAEQIHSYHQGSTTNNFTYMFELGGTWEFLDWLVMDIYGRWTNMGKLETTGEVFLTQIPHKDGHPMPEESFSYNDKKESGKLSAWDIGVRLRFLF